jgi:hypothetical protein
VLILEFGFDVVGARAKGSMLVLDTTRMIVPALFIWVAGKLPLQPVRFATNIAQPNDVCSFPS